MLFLSAGLSVTLLKQIIVPTDPTGLRMELGLREGLSVHPRGSLSGKHVRRHRVVPDPGEYCLSHRAHTWKYEFNFVRTHKRTRMESGRKIKISSCEGRTLAREADTARSCLEEKPA